MQTTDNNAIIVLTVGSSVQKQLCKTFISQLGLSDKNIEVLCDDELGGRIGSGGAILNALDKYYPLCQKLIIVNCGGLSKRAVGCSVKGKAFSQTLHSKKAITLFERILSNLLTLSCSFSKGILIACSDILVDTKNIKTDFADNIGFGIVSDIQTGTQHGVMIKNQEDKLIRFLHKADIKTLKNHVVPGCEQVIVDSGMVFLNDEFVCQLINLINTEKILDIVKKNKVELNFYSDIMPLLSKETEANVYLNDGIQNPSHLSIKNILYENLSSFELRVYTVDKHMFFHFGTNKQLLDNTFSVSDKENHFLKINSCISDNTHIGHGTVFDNVCLPENSHIGCGCLVSDIVFNHPVNIEDDRVVCGFKLNDATFVTVITDINENPKDIVNSTEIWDIPRFYKAKSFDESLNKFLENTNEKKYSLKYCTENADINYYVLIKQYISGLIQNSTNEQYFEKRKKIIDNYFCANKTPPMLVPTCDFVNVSMPARVNLSGTWTDAMPYCIDNGGEVINVAVTINHALPINVKLEKLDKKIIEFCSDDCKTEFSFDDDIDDFSDFNLHKSVLKTINIKNSNQLSCGLRLSTKVNIIDKGSGLGTSSILLAACFRAFSEMFNLDYSKDDIIGMVFVSEQIMKTGGGWQDQVGGMFPSIKLASSDPGITQKITVEKIALSEKFMKIFSEKAVLMPTGERHFGRFIVNDVVNRYLCGTKETDFVYSQMKALNQSVLNSIKEDDAAAFYECINQHMHILKLISPIITGKRIDDIIHICKQAANAVSICGAGAGGYLLVFLKDEFSIDDFKLFISEKLPDIKSEILKIDIFNQGDIND